MKTDRSTRLSLLTPPADEPLTLVEAKSFLRIEHDADDDAITRAISAARGAAEEYLRMLLLPQTYSYEFSEAAHIIPLPVGPAQSIAQIEAFDSEGNGTEINAANYRLTIDGYGLVFPNIPSGCSFAVEFTAGLAEAAENIPAPILQGMLHHIAAMMENRQGAVTLLPQAIHCYQPYRRVRL